MDWNDVRIFHAVAHARSLAQGARQMGMDRSTASRRIACLEDALGARLFLRTHQGLLPSPTGERLLVHAERMASEARALETQAADDAGRATGLVRIATTEAIAVMLVHKGLLSLRERHPDLDIELLAGNRPVDLGRGEADLALRVASVKEPNLRVRRVARLAFSILGSDSYLSRRGRPRSEEDLAGHEVLLLAGELAALPESKWLGTRPGVRIALRSSSVTALLAAALEGHGLAVLAIWGDGHPGLVRLFDVPAIAARSLCLVMHPDAAARTAVKVVADHLATIVGKG